MVGVVQTVEGTRVSVWARTCGEANSGVHVPVDMTPAALHLCAGSLRKGKTNCIRVTRARP